MNSSVAVAKPVLRGYLHAVVTPLALVATAWLAWTARDSPAKLASLLVYGVALVVLFGFSGVYHIGNWGPTTREVLRRLDHSNIYVLIAGTYTPVAVTILRGPQRLGILLAAWVPAVAGIVVVALGLRLPRWFAALMYVLVGWVAVFFFPTLVRQFDPRGLALIAAGGLCYSIGAACYATRRPRLWPRVFGYHEVFHVLVVAGSVLFFAFILLFVMPLSPA